MEEDGVLSLNHRLGLEALGHGLYLSGTSAVSSIVIYGMLVPQVQANVVTYNSAINAWYLVHLTSCSLWNQCTSRGLCTMPGAESSPRRSHVITSRFTFSNWKSSRWWHEACRTLVQQAVGQVFKIKVDSQQMCTTDSEVWICHLAPLFRMVKQGVQPGVLTFNSLVNACAKADILACNTPCRQVFPHAC